MKSKASPSKKTPSKKTPQTFEDGVDLIISDLRKILIKKQGDYGHGNITAFGEYGVLVRSHDKMARLKNLMTKKQTPNNESIEDSWADLANYAVIALMLRRDVFKLPLKS